MPDWDKLPETRWQKIARTQASWEKIADTDPMKLWLRASPESPRPIPSPSSSLVLGVRRDGQTLVELNDKLRTHHIYIIGVPGHGKSTLLINLMKQDIDQGRGFAVIDPHGELVDKLLPHIPEQRIPDTVYFNPADETCPTTINPLAAATDQERHAVLGNFMVLFQRLFQVTDAPRLLHILRHVVLTLLESGNDKTFLDIRSLLVDTEFRARVLEGIHNLYLREFWDQEFPELPKNAIAAIINKLGEFRINPAIRNTLGSAQTSVDFAEIMRTGKIFIANLSQGKIQEGNSTLLGSIITSMIQLAAMGRASLAADARPLFTLYIDEFQNFTNRDSSAFEKIISEARKYNLALVLAHQRISQIPREMRSAVVTVDTIVVFRLGHEDAKFLQSAFPSDEINEKVVLKLQNLVLGETIVRSGPAHNNFPMMTYPDPPSPSPNYVRDVIEYSRTHYGVPPVGTTPPSRQPTPAATAQAKPTEEPHPTEGEEKPPEQADLSPNGDDAFWQ